MPEPIVIKDAGIDIPRLPVPARKTKTYKEIVEARRAQIPKQQLATWDRIWDNYYNNLNEFHLAGQHDQQSHGSWADGGVDSDFDPATGRNRGGPKRNPRPVTVSGNIAYVPVSDDPNAPKATIDAEKADEAGKYRWHEDAKGYPATNVNGRAIRMHLLLFGKAEEGKEWDHTNRDKYDNTSANLEPKPRSGNMRNRGMMPQNTSGFKGVSFRKTRNKWVAHIRIEGKLIYLGSADTPEEAYELRKAGEMKYFGEISE